MTAVASPPSLQPLWETGKNGSEGLDSISAEEVSRIFMPRKSAQRQNSSSSTTSTSTTNSTSLSSTSATTSSSAPSIPNGDLPPPNGDQGGWGPRKKVARFWPSTKSEAVSGLSTARGQPLTTPSSGQSAASTMSSALQQPTPGLASQQSQPHQNGLRTEHQTPPRNEPTAVLALQPLTGTFERKQIVVPFLPDVQKIGRQTNQKTIPAANNGFFDSKVLSRQHAEIWADRNGKIWIRDVKSSNGTFVNGQRLSQENKESDPHELREGDTLELGIDIVSEDQKSIVHHKVSAKVELAGLYNNAPSILDMMQMDPGVGQPILGDPTSQQLAQIRGRGGSQGLVGSNSRLVGPPSMAGNNANLLAGQRQMNMWMNPITIEQVVKKLATELKQAKQHSQNLHQTSDFFNTLLNLEPGEEPPKSPPKNSKEKKQPNELLSALPVDPTSHFSQPPAPPPSQPLPEKPDFSHYAVPDSPAQPNIKRADTERPLSTQSSPARPEPQNGQIILLLQELKSAKQEIDSRGDRMKYLEDALKQERKARQTAERRARALYGTRATTDHHVNGSIDDEAFESPLDSLELIENDLPNGHLEIHEDHGSLLLNSSPSMETLRDMDSRSRNIDPAEDSISSIENRYEVLKQEFDQMKILMESYRLRAEEAEESQRKFAELVENIKVGHDSDASTSSAKSTSSTLVGNDVTCGTPAFKDHTTQPNGPNYGLWSRSKHKNLPNGTVIPPSELQEELERTVADAINRHHADLDGGGKGMQSAPYVSMIGVVLIGVGLMTWLNGWQPSGGGKVVE